jgi:aspartyl/asparaginyl-tRNA synthetase
MLTAYTENKEEESMDETVKLVVDTYEKQCDTYKNKSVSFLVRITADMLRMKYDQVQDILEKHYSDDAE